MLFQRGEAPSPRFFFSDAAERNATHFPVAEGGILH